VEQGRSSEARDEDCPAPEDVNMDVEGNQKGPFQAPSKSSSTGLIYLAAAE
jgi:hypothetical protein